VCVLLLGDKLGVHLLRKLAREEFPNESFLIKNVNAEFYRYAITAAFHLLSILTFQNINVQYHKQTSSESGMSKISKGKLNECILRDFARNSAVIKEFTYYKS
jgi:hypothetical protein